MIRIEGCRQDRAHPAGDGQTQRRTRRAFGARLRVTGRNVSFSEDQARGEGERIGIVRSTSRFDIEQFRMGVEIELENGRADSAPADRDSLGSA